MEKEVPRFRIYYCFEAGLTYSLRGLCTRYKVREDDLPIEARCQTDFVAREYGTLVPKGKTCARATVNMGLWSCENPVEARDEKA